MYECCNDEDAERGLGAFLEGWGDRTTKPFGLRVGRLPIFNLPPVSTGQRPFFLGFMRVFGESYLPLLGAIRWSPDCPSIRNYWCACYNVQFCFVALATFYLYDGILIHL